MYDFDYSNTEIEGSSSKESNYTILKVIAKIWIWIKTNDNNVN